MNGLKARWLLLVLAASGAPGCFYATLDTDSLEAKALGEVDADGDGDGSVFLDGADAGREEPTTSLDTPPIERSTGETTRDPCVQTTEQITQLFTITCAGCHAPPASMGSFQSILDFPALVNAVSNTQMDPETGEPVRLLIPGDPEGSRVYRRIAAGEMPPRRDATLPPLPRPTISDLSLMREWIQYCLPEGDLPAPELGEDGSQ